MSAETIAVIVVAVIVMAIFGMFRRKRDDGKTRVIVVDGSKDIRSDAYSGDSRGPSTFKKLLLSVVSLAAGFAAVGALFEFVLQPEGIFMDPYEPIAFVFYAVAAMVIYGILRLFVRG